jgi:hypothetical protein
MKTNTTPFLKNALAIMFVLMAAAACKKSDNSTPSTSSGKFTFKVDGGAAIIIDSASATLYSTTTGRQMDVYAFKGGKQVIEFHFDPKTGSKTVGTAFGSGAFLTYADAGITSYDSQSGTFNLTTFDTISKKIEGDFSFVGKVYPYTGSAIKTITEGHMVVTKITK